MPQRWDEERLFSSGDEYFAELVTSISRAGSSIEMESYIFIKGRAADRVIGALIEAARRGVRVRLIVDGWGSPAFLWDYWPLLKKAGVKTRFFRVVPLILRRLPGDPEGLVQRILNRWRGLNRGNHRKFCLIDQQELYVGSFNVSDDHLSEVNGDKAWKDLGVRVSGKELRYAKRAFQRAFRGWTALNWPMRSPELLLLNDSILHKRRSRNEHLWQIKNAKGRIWLATPYFVPIRSVVRALLYKAKRGVDVRIMVPQENDVFIMHWLSWPLLQALARRGVKVFIYKPRFSHQKLFIADDWICIGSTNLNHRSFLHDLEMDVVITHEGNRRFLIEMYQADQKMSELFDRSEWANLPFWQRWITSVLILLKYWA